MYRRSMEALVLDMTEEGHLSIPAEVRQRLNWTPKEKVFVQIATRDKSINSFTGGKKAPRLGALAALGYAKTFRECRPTDEWMKELREGEQE